MVLLFKQLLACLSLSALSVSAEAPDGPATDPRLAHAKEGVYFGRQSASGLTFSSSIRPLSQPDSLYLSATLAHQHCL
jgi:hypothetical protein